MPKKKQIAAKKAKMATLDLPNVTLSTESNLAIIGTSSRYLEQTFTVSYKIVNCTETTTTTTTTTTTLKPTTKKPTKQPCKCCNCDESESYESESYESESYESESSEGCGRHHRHKCDC